ncbi:MAG: hypothetical protein MUO53_12345 [Maribacter sp.]|nr:hypothetical protein [Maribacter sp.]
MKNIVLVILLFMIPLMSHAQLNEYKYIIVPKKFDGFRNENQYQTSTLFKYLLVQKGFEAVYDDALPEDLNANRCLGLLLDFEDLSSMFSTKVILKLKDCNSAVIMATELGKSKEKDFKLAYNEAIKDAFRSFDAINYSYNPKDKDEEPVTLRFKNDVKKLEEPPKETPKNRKEQVAIEEVTPERQTYKSVEPVPSDLKKGENDMAKATPSPMAISDVLYAQEVPNGYQLVDSTPKIRLKLFKTSKPDQYLAKSDEIEGIVYAKEGKWFFEYYVGDQLRVEELNIKF